jgi:hypothetical protein
VLPSSVWRIAGIVFHLPLDGSAVSDRGSGDVPSWLPMEVYVVVLSILSEVLAFTAVGLIARWGEVFPQWVPGLRGRIVPRLAAVIPAALGAAALRRYGPPAPSRWLPGAPSKASRSQWGTC